MWNVDRRLITPAIALGSSILTFGVRSWHEGLGRSTIAASSHSDVRPAAAVSAQLRSDLAFAPQEQAGTAQTALAAEEPPVSPPPPDAAPVYMNEAPAAPQRVPRSGARFK
jgi:hypothetical protein